MSSFTITKQKWWNSRAAVIIMKLKEMDHIPLDLTVEILTRLPSKSLMKFKCVSKLWSSIITSQVFIDSFYSISSTRPRFIVAFTNGLFAKPKREEKRLFIFSSSHKGDESSSLTTSLDMTLPSLNVASPCVSVHGFIACSLYARLFMICNPSTRQVIVLPILPSRVAPDMRGSCLGYDPVDDQFKALSLISSRLPNDDSVEHLVLTLKGDKNKYSWRQIRGNNNTPPYFPVTMKVCINGVMYYGAWAPRRGMNPVIVCFDVRSEKITFIKAPRDVVAWWCHSIFMEYKGKLASIVRYPYDRFHSFDLWVLEDIEKQEWSKQTCEIPFSVWDSVGGIAMSFPGTNKVGELILAPQILSRKQTLPFYIFYYHVETNNIRRVRLEGIADDQSFRHCYGIGTGTDQCEVYISPEHVENIRFL